MSYHCISSHTTSTDIVYLIRVLWNVFIELFVATCFSLLWLKLSVKYWLSACHAEA